MNFGSEPNGTISSNEKMCSGRMWHTLSPSCHKTLLNFADQDIESLHDEFFDYKSLFVKEINIGETEVKREEDDEGNDNVQYGMDVIWY